jgi:glycosyltransferase involved in cell wall biosynthesis
MMISELSWKGINMHPKLISVIIPTYNRSAMISDAIDSILQQDIRDYELEILVVDDGSKDNTKDVLKKYIDKKEIRYIYKQNGGAGSARNMGIAQAQGRWVTFLDSDDRWLPFHLTLQMSVLEKIPECKVLFSDFMITHNGMKLDGKGLDFWAYALNGTRAGRWKDIFPERFESNSIGVTHKGESFQIFKGNIYKGMLSHPCMPCWTTIVARECLEEHVRFAEDFPTWEDVWFSCQLAEHNEIYYMDYMTAENRGHDGPRLTGLDPEKRIKCHIDICDRIYFVSKSPHRPSIKNLISFYAQLHKDLFKQYVRQGLTEKAAEVRSALDAMGMIPKDIKYLFYVLGSLSPGRPLHYLIRIKQLFEKD